MASVATALLFALFVWWFATGVVLLLVLRARRPTSLVLAALLFPLALLLLGSSAGQTSVLGAYLAFTGAILLWGTQEIAFLVGAVTGPRPLACPPGATGWPRLRAALGAILYHELALIGTGALLLAVTAGAPNQVGALTFLVLWTMRLSAKLNLFLGVPVLNDQVLPPPIGFLRSYFLRGPVNGFFPVAVVLSVLGLSALVRGAANPEASAAVEVGYVLVAALMALAIIEHMFMLVPLPVDRLWAWSTRGAPVAKPAGDTPRQGPRDVPRDVPTGEIERAAATSP